MHCYLEAENAYTEASLAPLAPLQSEIYNEILSRLELERRTVPAPDGAWEYLERIGAGDGYSIHSRRLIGAVSEAEQVVLDENRLAAGRAYFSLEYLIVSPDHQLCAYAFDPVGNERLVLEVLDIASGERVAGPFNNVAGGGAAWAEGGKSLLFLELDAYNRPCRVMRCHPDPDDPGNTANVIHTETDEAFRLRIGLSESGAYVFLIAWANDTTEVLIADAAETAATFWLLHPRQTGVQAYTTHWDSHFHLLVTDDSGCRILRRPVSSGPEETWQLFHTSGPHCEITAMNAFARHLVLHERMRGVPQHRIIGVDGSEEIVALPEAVRALHPEENRDFDTARFRFGYDSLTTPYTIYDYDMDTSHLELRDRWRIHGYDPAAYVSERRMVKAADGIEIPLSILHRKDFPRSCERPVLLYGYGAYGFSLEAEFSSLRLSLVDRGFAFAIAHVRGGGELGQRWHEAGWRNHKSTGISDFIACADHLLAEGYAAPDRLAAMGESAGGLLVAAALNQRPDLFAAAVVDCPFVDVVATLSDATLPFTASEWREWGDPRCPEALAWLRQISPVETITEGPYPPILAFGSFNDPRVPYWETPIWAEQIRDRAGEKTPIWVKMRMDAGHQGHSDCFEEIEEWALIYAFLIDRVGL